MQNVFIVDSADPLRKVYPFLSDEYEQYIGCALATIPAPDENGEPGNDGRTYAQHFLEPFLANLEQIDVRQELSTITPHMLTVNLQRNLGSLVRKQMKLEKSSKE